MIKYALNIEPEKFEPGLDYTDGIVFSGSCFSDHIALRMTECRFHVFSQPNGVVFNPISIADAFQRLNGRDYSKDDLVHYNGLWHSKYHHGSFSEIDEAAVLKKANHTLHELKRHMEGASFLFITFGSAYVYEHTQTGELYANCHKIPQKAFRKRRLSVEEIVLCWSDLISSLKGAYPQLRIVFTVSPVKHLRDGVIENTISKSTLFMAIHQLMKQETSLLYFPAWELVNDDLRDYRFYEQDGAHPNAMAMAYVYEKFKAAVYDKATIVYTEEVEQFNQMCRHRFLREDGEAYLQFMRSIESKRNELNLKYGLEL